MFFLGNIHILFQTTGSIVEVIIDSRSMYTMYAVRLSNVHLWLSIESVSNP